MKVLAVFGTLIFCINCIQNSTLKLSIFYETLCSDSAKFFRNQLNKTYEKVGSSLQLEFVPYGHAFHEQVNGTWVFHCQHSEKECIGNKYHACELAQNNGQTIDMKFLSCAMNRSNPASPKVLKKCANHLGLNFEPIEKCFQSSQSDQLLIKHGERTTSVIPKIKFIPTITINGVFDQEVQNKSQVDLLGTICGFLNPKPKACTSISEAPINTIISYLDDRNKKELDYFYQYFYDLLKDFGLFY